MEEIQSKLIAAIDNGDVDGIQNCLENGASLTVADKAQFLPLHRAVSRNQMESVKALLAAGADPNAEDPCNSRPLHIATTERNLDMIKLLVENGADINAKSEARNSPKIGAEDIARRNGDAALAETIRRISKENNRGRT